MSKYSDYTKAWRKAHPEERKRDRTNYYHHHHDYGRGDRRKYSIPECLAVLTHNITDVTLAINLCRSVRSIHVKRSKLLKEMEEGKHAHLLELVRGCKGNRTRVSGNGNHQQTRDYAGQRCKR